MTIVWTPIAFEMIAPESSDLRSIHDGGPQIGPGDRKSGNP